MTRLVNQLRFRKDDPRRDLHVPKAERLTADGDTLSDASTDPDLDFDRDEVRRDMRVVSEGELQ